MKIGAAWLRDRKDQNGNVMMNNGRPVKNISIVVEIPFLGKINLVCVKADEKKNEKSPDFDVLWYGEDTRQQGTGSQGNRQGASHGGYDDEPGY